MKRQIPTIDLGKLFRMDSAECYQFFDELLVTPDRALKNNVELVRRMAEMGNMDFFLFVARLIRERSQYK